MTQLEQFHIYTQVTSLVICMGLTLRIKLMCTTQMLCFTSCKLDMPANCKTIALLSQSNLP